MENNLKRTKVETGSFGSLSILWGENTKDVEDYLSNKFKLPENANKEIKAYLSEGKLLRGVIELDPNKTEITSVNFISRAKDYFNVPNPEMIRYYFIQIDDKNVLMLENPAKDYSLVGNLEDHLTSTIASICY